MQTIISLKHFALTGEFGPVHMGMDIESAIELLGTPDCARDFGHGSAAVYYAWYEIFYDSFTKKIVGIQNDHLIVRDRQHRLDIFFETEKAKLDKWFLRFTRSTTYEETLALLNEQDIFFRITPHFDDHIIKLSSGVTLDFDTDPKNGNRVLNGIRHFVW